MPYIYKITNKINGKSYIGKTLKTVKERWSEHCQDYKKERSEKRPLYSAMTKYGINNFLVEEVEECSEADLNEREKYWIEFYGTFKYGYNATIGGDGKQYIDYDLVISLYNQIQNQSEVAKQLNICPDSVSKILRSRKIIRKSSQEVSKEKLGKKVKMCDKYTHEIIKVFPSRNEAAQWLIDNNKTRCKKTTIGYHITEVCNKKRKSAAGYYWEVIK